MFFVGVKPQAQFSDGSLRLIGQAVLHIPQARVHLPVWAKGHHPSIAAAESGGFLPFILLLRRLLHKPLLKQAGVQILVDFVVDHPVRQLDELVVQLLRVMLLPHILKHAVGRDVAVAQAVQVPDGAGEIGQILRRKGNLGAGNRVHLEQMFCRLGNYIIAARSVVENTAGVMQCLIPVDADSDGEVTVVFPDKLLHPLVLEEHAVGGNRDHVIVSPGVAQGKRLALKIFDRFVDELDFQKRLAANKIQDNGRGGVVHKLPRKQPVHNPLCRFPAHPAAGLVALVTVGAGQIAGFCDAEGHVLAEHVVLLVLLFWVQLAVDAGNLIVVAGEILPGHVELISRCRLHYSPSPSSSVSSSSTVPP